MRTASGADFTGSVEPLLTDLVIDGNPLTIQANALLMD